ncbi:MAG: LPS export ABC transporter ATP-binding protein [Proteobacteria bacterium]|nr:LPS export ABC transporter ATP-binding protein [Cystobacterineae bacterium]MCL2314610.1 LPS export ABC transporter ATP-binding protein [Pseudomonadota bacterium]
MAGVLEASALVKQFRKHKVVSEVSFSVSPGEVVGLLGPNGAGKTTSFNMVVGLLKPDGGEVHLSGKNLTGLALHRRARLGLGYLPQEASIFRKLTVKQNFLAVLELDKRLTKAEREARAQSMLAEFSLEHVYDNLGENLSGGERRRTEIARALLAKPSILLLDEPFAGVDPINVAELQKEIARLKAKGLGILITDHNVQDTLRVCDRAYLIVNGKILEEGSPHKLSLSPLARSLYLGENFQLHLPSTTPKPP